MKISTIKIDAPEYPELLKQITSNYSSEQKDNFYKQVEQMGFAPEVVNKVKGINT